MAEELVNREAYVDSAALASVEIITEAHFLTVVLFHHQPRWRFTIWRLCAAFCHLFFSQFSFCFSFCLRLDLALRACTSSAFFVHPQVKITLMKGDGFYLGCIIYEKGYSVFLSVISKGWKLTLWIWYCHCNMISFLSADMSLSQ